MEWYQVVKTIRGRRYLYWQKTYRLGSSVKTLNKYIGPYDGRHLGRISPIQHPDLAGAVTLPLPFPTVLPYTISVESVLNTLQGETTRDWWHAWYKHRLKRSGNLVSRDGRIDAMIVNLKVTWSNRDSGCWYSPSTDTVNIPKEYRFCSTDKQTATQAYYVVVFHELVHWTKRRVGRDRFLGVGVGIQGAYAAEELVAELGALTLMKALGKDVGDEKRHAHYFQHWLHRLPESERAAAIEYAKQEAAKAVKYILQHDKAHNYERPSERDHRDASRADQGQPAFGANRVHDALMPRPRAGGNRRDEQRREKSLKVEQVSRRERNDYERMRWGTKSYRIKKAQTKLRAAKRRMKGVKRLNPFIGRT